MTPPQTRIVGGRADALHTDDPGLASSFDRPPDRLMSKDGGFHVTRVGQLGGLSSHAVAQGEARLHLSKLSEFTPEPAPERLPS